MSEATKAVFLSYASQDTEAAKRICEALRAVGVEVWFDQSELVGGDAWDQKIRKQIKDCALLIPVISQNTQARAEGYFRLEWRLADQRTHLMGRSKAFLMPVAIDGTSDADADVPDSFTAVQWTKAPGGEVPPAFAARVKKLLDGGPSSREAGSNPPIPASRELGPPREKNGPSKWWWALPMFGVAMALALVMKEGRKEPPPTTPAPAAAPVSEARRLASKAAALVADGDDANRGALATAEDFLKRAVEMDPTDGEVAAIYAQVSRNFTRFGYDRSTARRDLTRQLAERAVLLAPNSPEAQFALAYHYYGENPAEAEKILRQMLVRQPDDKRLLRTLGLVVRVQSRPVEEALEIWRRAAALPGSDAASLAEIALSLYGLERMDEAEAALDRSLALKTTGRNLMLKLRFQLYERGDLDGALASLKQLPAWTLSDDRGAFQVSQVWLWRRQPDQVIAALNRVPRDYLVDNFFTGPKLALTGQAHQLAGRTAAARSDWTQALQLVERMLAEGRTNALLFWRAWLQAVLGDQAAAEASLRTYDETDKGNSHHNESLARIEVQLGRLPAALDSLERREKNLGGSGAIGGFQNGHQPGLRYDPAWDPLRGDPRFHALLAQPTPVAAATPSPASGLLARPELVERAPSARLEVESKSVAVLAFANLSDDKANEYFSDGISEELLNVLAKIPGLKVAARTSAFYFKGKDTPIPEIAKQLGVAYVVEGSVRRQGNQVRITAQLIKATDGFHVWSENFTRDLKDIFAVQDEIAGLIAKNLELKMGMAAAGSHGTISTEAHQAYLLGRAAFAKASMADVREAVMHFKQAVTLEPKYAAAWVQLAGAHTQLGRWGGAAPLESWREARIAIDRAKELEPDSPDMLLALGWIRRTGDWDWRGAEQAFRRALELRPGHPETLAGLAVLLFNVGQTTEAFRLGREAVRLDPLNPSAQIDLSIMFHFNRDWLEAERAVRRALQLAPRGTGYHSILAWSLIPQRRFAEAEAEIALETDLVEAPMNYGLLAIARGDPAEARRRIAEMEELARTRGDVSDLQQSLAWLYAPLGEKDRAFAALEKARASRDPSMSWLRNSYYLEALFADPRWPELLRKLGLADEQVK